ncbi:MAG: Fe-Mn family superoxide dismutase [Methylococcales bacterium]|nr:Fe-Mn family superoxide dismutase [Methylococcales bacterium]
MSPSPYTRRDFLVTASAGAALATFSNNVFAAGTSSETSVPALISSSFTATHEPKPLPFNPAKLDGLSEKLISSHWGNNYTASVKALNTVNKLIATALNDANTPPFAYNDLKREHLLRTGSIVLHELYFHNLGGSGKPEASFQKVISEAFGSYDTWEKEFKRIGTGLGGGSGWVLLGYNLHIGLLENYWLWDHLHSPAATLPILVMDMYEHSYQMDYGAAAPAYIDAFFRNIQWNVVAFRLEKARQIRTLIV